MKAHSHLSVDIGCGHLAMHTKRGDIGIDRVKGKCDVCCDAHVLPFRPNIFDVIYLMWVLEHLQNPHICIPEVIRVAKQSAILHITIPQITNVPKSRLFQAITEFPFGIIYLTRWLLRERHNPYEHLEHKTIVSPEWLMKHLKITAIDKISNHRWFYGTKGRIFRRLGIKDRTRRAGWRIEASIIRESS